MTSQTIRKSIFRIFVLRVSGKGDHEGSANQLEVLRGYEHVPGVSWLLEHFDLALMQASSARGRRLREEWTREHELRVLSRRGRDDFLGVSLVVDGTRFVLYASTASQMDEDSGNAFTRYLIEFIKEPAFTGHADPEFTARRDRGELDEADHPSLCNAFDATRFVRSLPLATDLWEAAKWARAAFDVKDVRVDPEAGEAQQMVWQFLAFGSQMEVEVGKVRRFVGRLNLARAGFFPYREGAAPLGFTTAEGRTRSIVVKEDEIAAVAALQSLGMTSADMNEIAQCLGGEHGVCSSDQKTDGVAIHNLEHPGTAARRLFLTRKLTAYRDGELELRFTGVLPNRLKPGSGHVLQRRWLGLDSNGNHDELGEITYRIPAPKPTVRDPRGRPRQGWLDGLTDAEEHTAWTALIARRGWDDSSGPVPGTATIDDDLLSTASARSGPRRRDQDIMALSRLCLFRDDEAGENGPRTKLFSRATGGRYELRRERAASAKEGLRYKQTDLLASWPDHELRAHVATLLRQAAYSLLEQGHELAPLPTHAAGGAHDDACGDASLRDEAARKRRLAEGYDEAEAAELASGDPDEERLRSLRAAAREARRAARELIKKADAVAAEPRASADFGQLRDVIAALEGPFANGLAPASLNRALRDVFPGGLRFTPGPDSITLTMSATVEVPVQAGGTTRVTPAVLVPHAAGKGATIAGEMRIADLAKRYMRDGQTLEDVAWAGRIQHSSHVLCMIREALTSGSRRVDGQLDVDEQRRRMPDPQRRAAAFASPILELRAIVWHRLTGTLGRPATATSAYTELINNLYFAEPPASRAGATAGGHSRPWAWDSNVDHRLDQHTILESLPGTEKQLRADFLGHALNVHGAKPGYRLVLESSTDIARNGHRYPRTLRRLPVEGHPDGWYGKKAGARPASEKLVGLPLCPHRDCPERYATAIVMAPEVLHFGTAVLCRRCRRPATATHAAARTVFPASVIAWADSRARRTGAWVGCAAPGCRVDLGAGPGMAWKWDDTPGAVWHSDDCRAGVPPVRYARCAYLACALDEGGGPGTLDVTGQRSTRRWHSRECEHAELRRRRAETRAQRFGHCAWSECTRDEGNGPGSIAGAHHAQKTHDNPECRSSARRDRSLH